MIYTPFLLYFFYCGSESNLKYSAKKKVVVVLFAIDGHVSVERRKLKLSI